MLSHVILSSLKFALLWYLYLSSIIPHCPSYSYPQRCADTAPKAKSQNNDGEHPTKCAELQNKWIDNFHWILVFQVNDQTFVILSMGKSILTFFFFSSGFGPDLRIDLARASPNRPISTGSKTGTLATLLIRGCDDQIKWTCHWKQERVWTEQTCTSSGWVGSCMLPPRGTGAGAGGRSPPL